VIVKQRFSVLRVLATCALSLLLVFIAWAVTWGVTLGTEVMRRELFAQSLPMGFGPPTFLGMSEPFKVSALLDFMLWFAVVWGVQNLWIELHETVQEDKTKPWLNPMRRLSTPINAMLGSLPFSYYVVLGVAMVVNRGRLPESDSVFAGEIALSLAVCAAAVCALFALAVRFLPRSAT
jgi:hypothetical protein